MRRLKGWSISFAVGPEAMTTVPALAMSGFMVPVLGAPNGAVACLQHITVLRPCCVSRFCRAPNGSRGIRNWFVDISDVLASNMEALQVYGGEMRPWPHLRSYKGMEHLARWHGARIGYAAVGAFMLERKIR